MNLFTFIASIFGLIIGSFLNVVIYRYPKMLVSQWRRECQDFLELTQEPNGLRLTLAHPGSHCTQCQKKLKPWHNIPLLSFIFLKGHCAYCNTRIPWRYPLVELTSAIATALAFIHFGFSALLLYALFFSWAMITLFMIDFNTKYLPDTLTLSLLWLGLFANLNHAFTSLSHAVLGAIVGYLILWLIAKLFLLVRKKEGMGHGDFKLLAALGAWFGFGFVPIILFTAVILCLLVSLILMSIKKIKFDELIPFGPFLALMGWVTLLWHSTLLHLTLRLLG